MRAVPERWWQLIFWIVLGAVLFIAFIDFIVGLIVGAAIIVFTLSAAVMEYRRTQKQLRSEYRAWGPKVRTKP